MKKTLAAGAAVVAAALLAGSIGAASASAGWVECGTVKGPAWTVYGRKGTAYKVSADKVSCAFAEASRLFRKTCCSARVGLRLRSSAGRHV
jgi:hypothetical protein